MIDNNNIILDSDVSLEPILKKKVAIIGYGNQGRAQALNLNDSGISIKVGIRKNSQSITILRKDGLIYDTIGKVTQWADIICLLVPDKEIPNMYHKNIHPYLKKGQTLLFSHGFAVNYQLIKIPDDINIVMVAPSAGGAIVRQEFLKNSGVPTLLAIKQDNDGNSLELIKSYSKAIGGTRVCAFLSTFQEETETDLFGEQAILTGGLPYLMNASYKILINRGYNPTVAWFVCYYEIKTIVDLLYNKGIKNFYRSISDTARYGGISRGRMLIDESFEKKLNKILDDIKSESFNKELKSHIDSDLLPDNFDELDVQTSKIFKILKDK